MKNCKKFTKDIFCDGCDKLVIQNKEFSTNLSELKRQRPNECRHMLPRYRKI